MKYIRTKDGVYESDKTIFGKHTKTIIFNKKTNEVVTEMICDCIEEKSIIEDMLFMEYCKTHKLNPLDYCRKTMVINPFVIAQADTIEDLCDGCVCFIKGEDQPYICSVKDIEHLRKLEQFGGKIGTNLVYEKVYLTIWTDKGLIYVAKANKKGELELL